jgi:hypothetical protein
MPTNPPTITALERMADLIHNELAAQTSQDVVDEIKAWNRLLKKHIGQQKRQPNPYDGHSYEYLREKKKIRRTGGGKTVEY